MYLAFFFFPLWGLAVGAGFCSVVVICARPGFPLFGHLSHLLHVFSSFSRLQEGYSLCGLPPQEEVWNVCQASWSSGRELALLCFLHFLLTKESHKASADSSGKEVEFHLLMRELPSGWVQEEMWLFFFLQFPISMFCICF